MLTNKQKIILTPLLFCINASTIVSYMLLNEKYFTTPLVAKGSLENLGL